MESWIFIGITAYLCYAISTILDKYLMTTKRDPVVTSNFKMFLNGVILLIIGLIFFDIEFTPKLIFWSLVLGILYGTTNALQFVCIKYGKIREVIPFFQSFSILLIFILSISLLGEKVTAFNIIGIVLILIGIFMILTNEKFTIPKMNKLFLMMLSMSILTALYFIFAKMTVSTEKPISISIIMYLSSALILLIFNLYNKKHKQLFVVSNFKIIPTAIFGALGTLLLYIALITGDLSKINPLSGTVSIVVFIVGILFFKEKFYWHKLSGTIMAVIGIYFISI